MICVLIFTCFIESFFPFHKLLGWFIEFGASCLVTLYYLDWIVSLPYLSIVMGTWFIYIFMIHWFKTKWRVLVLILVSVISLSIIDTFTYHELWVEIIILISAGLLLLLVIHLKDLREKSPDGWEHLTDYPGTVISPIVIFFTVLFFFMIFAPDVRPLLKDPYTAWKDFTGGEKAISSYADISDLEDNEDSGQGEILSGYSRDDSHLGGTFNYDYSAVMSVETSYPTYYRGEVRYFYNGSGWEHEDTNYHLDSYVVLPDEASQSLPFTNESPVDRSLLETREVSQIITVSTNKAYRSHVLFGSSQIDTIEIVEEIELNRELGNNRYNTLLEEKGPLLWLPNVSELHYWDSAGMFPKIYQVTSQVPLIDEDGLRASTSIDPEDEYWDKYLHLPNELPMRVSELAKEIVDEKTTTYDQVKAIESYLKETYTYTTKPNLSLGKSDDFVDQFLFEVQEGYCDYFSTAMVVLTRTLDIPARWVKGYTQGTKQMNEMEQYYFTTEQDSLGPGVYNVLNANAHSWVEVYFPGYGWIPFEPTATFSAPTYTVAAEIGSELNETMSEQTHALEERSLPLVKILLTVIIVVAFLGIILLLWNRKLSFLWHVWKHRGVKSSNLRIVLEIERLLHYGPRLGYKYFMHETLHETFSRWIIQNRSLEKHLTELVLLFEKAKYSKEQMTDGELKLIKEKVHLLKKLMKTRG